MSKRLRCKLGFHSIWHDTLGVNYGTENTPIYFMETTRKCHYCDWSEPA